MTSAPEGRPHELLTHCGVKSTVIDGRVWIADPPLGDHNPPPGWDENRQQGVLRMIDPDTVEFDGGAGRVVKFRPAAEGEADPADGCE